MTNPLVLFLLGFILGILTGFFGVGGVFWMTPALNIFGLGMLLPLRKKLRARY